MDPIPYKIEARPDFSFLSMQIPRGQMVKVEASAMASMDSHLVMKTKLRGGFKRFLANESLFLNEFSAPHADGELCLAPGPAGDIEHYSISPQTPLILGSGAFLACGPKVELDTKWQGLTKGFFSGESFFLMHCSGTGDIWFNTYGSIFSLEIDGEYVVDTGHIAAFTPSLTYEIGRIGGYKSLFFSGEGFICRFRGQGRVWIQTKRPMGLVAWANRYRRVQAKG
jgi:uncharacterized protein (TIGR00266 family)